MNVSNIKQANPTPPKGASRMSLESVTSGVQKTPARVLIYGSEGIGKSTFAAGAPNPIWIGADNGTQHLNVKRFAEPQTWADVLDAVAILTTEKHDFQTVVFDPMKWIEDKLLVPHVCAANGWASIEEPGFGKGYSALDGQWLALVKALETMSRAKPMNVVFIAHQEVKAFRPPDLEGYDRYQVTMSKGGAALLRQWCDYVLFAREQEWVDIGKDKKVRGRSNGVRVFHSNKTAAFDAKARPALDTDPLPLSWESFAEAREKSDPAHRAARVVELKAAIAEKLAMLDADAKAKGEAFLAKLAPDAVEKAEEALNRITIKVQEMKQKESA